MIFNYIAKSFGQIVYKLVVIGSSAGGIPLLQNILMALPKSYPLPIVIVSHLPSTSFSHLAQLLSRHCLLPVNTVFDKAEIIPGQVFIAPSGYHLLIETQTQFALSIDPPVQSVRPSIDVLFQSAAEVFEKQLIAVILSGANRDGVQGIATVKALGGLTIVLDPKFAEFNIMPKAVIQATEVEYIVNLEEIIALLQAVKE
ncbi:MAG: hypothetical protein RL637_989 [Pseudomonadota bacterium]